MEWGLAEGLFEGTLGLLHRVQSVRRARRLKARRYDLFGDAHTPLNLLTSFGGRFQMGVRLNSIFDSLGLEAASTVELSSADRDDRIGIASMVHDLMEEQCLECTSGPGFRGKTLVDCESVFRLTELGRGVRKASKKVKGFARLESAG